MNRGLIMAVVIIFIVLGVFQLYNIVVKVSTVGDEYISDEQWYVISSINILRKVFGVEPDTSINKTHVLVSIVVNESIASLEDCLASIREAVGSIETVKTIDGEIAAATVLVSRGALPRLKTVECVEDVFPGYLADAYNVNNYMNWEHPPLGKYLIGLSLLVLGYDWFAWRLPSIIASLASIPLLVYLLYHLLGPSIYFLLALLLAGFAILVDPFFSSMSSVAMLDPLLGFFTLASLVSLTSNKFLLSSVFLGLAGSVKYSGFFPAPVLYLAMRLRGFDSKRALTHSFIVPLLVFLVLSTPLILYLGPLGWLSELAGAVAWHLSSRPSGPPPVDWPGLVCCFGSFPLYYVGWVPYLVAECSPVLATAALASLALFVLAGPASGLKRLWLLYGYMFAIIAGYLVVFVAGNRTLYQFYTMHYYWLLVASASTLPAAARILLATPSSSILQSYRLLVSRLKPHITRTGFALLASAIGYTIYQRGVEAPVTGLPSMLGEWAGRVAALSILLYGVYGYMSKPSPRRILMLAVAVASAGYGSAIVVPLTLSLLALNAPLVSWALALLVSHTPVAALAATKPLYGIVATGLWFPIAWFTSDSMSFHVIYAAVAILVYSLVSLRFKMLWRFRGTLIPLLDATTASGLWPLWLLAPSRDYVWVTAALALVAASLDTVGYTVLGIATTLVSVWSRLTRLRGKPLSLPG